MYNEPLGLTVAGQSWTLSNPYRGRTDPETANLRNLRQRSDRMAARSWMSGIAVAAVTGLLVLLCGGVAFIAVLSALPAGFLAGWSVDAHHRYQVSVSRAAVDALDTTLGPRRLLNSQLTDPRITALAAAAVTAAHTVSTSHTFDRGLLGEPQVVAADLRILLWDCVCAADDLDGSARMLSAAGPAYADASDQLALSVQNLAAHVDALTAAAADVGELDAVLTAAVTAEVVEQALAALPAAPSTAPLDEVRAHIAAARDVIGHGGR